MKTSYFILLIYENRGIYYLEIDTYLMNINRINDIYQDRQEILPASPEPSLAHT
jgi:hypothetical protein